MFLNFFKKYKKVKKTTVFFSMIVLLFFVLIFTQTTKAFNFKNISQLFGDYASAQFGPDLVGDISAGPGGELIGDSTLSAITPALSLTDPFSEIGNIDATTLSKNSYFGNDANPTDNKAFRYIHEGTASQVLQLSPIDISNDLSGIALQTATSSISEDVVIWKNPFLATSEDTNGKVYISELGVTGGMHVGGNLIIDGDLTVTCPGNIYNTHILWTDDSSDCEGKIARLIADTVDIRELTIVKVEKLDTMIIKNGEENSVSGTSHDGSSEPDYRPSGIDDGEVEIDDPTYISNNLRAYNIFVDENMFTTDATIQNYMVAGWLKTTNITGLGENPPRQRYVCANTTTGYIHICGLPN